MLKDLCIIRADLEMSRLQSSIIDAVVNVLGHYNDQVVKTDEVPQENKSENCGGCIIMMMMTVKP